MIHRYDGKCAVKIDRLAVERGEIFGIIGPNGAGKSTLFRILNLLEKPTEGEVIFNGEVVNSSADRLKIRRRMAMVFQEPLLFDTSVFENVAYGLKLRKKSPQEVKEKVKRWLHKLNISHLALRHGSQLSGGEAQRVSLARALVIEPEVFLLDEPFASLDPPSKEALREDLYGIIKEAGLTTIHVTHDQTEALILADRLAVMEEGRILQIGTPFEVFNYPAEEAVANFVGVETILAGKVISQVEGLATVEVDGEKIQAVSDAEVGRNVLLCIRPEEVVISPFPIPRSQFTEAQEPRARSPEASSLELRAYSSARNRFVGRITKIVNFGALTRVSLNCGFPLVAFATKQSLEELQLEENQQVCASVKATAVHVIKK